MQSYDVPTRVMEKFGIVAKKRGKEFHSPCPECGGRDRMIWWERGNGWCRQCDFKTWIDDGLKVENLAERAAYLAQCIAKEKKIEQDKLAAWQDGFKTGYLWGWHDAMTATQREWWHSQGIDDEMIDLYALGYCRNKIVKVGDNEYITANAYTIPILDPHTGKLVNIQYRLENPPAGVGKYRQENDLQARNFYASGKLGEDVIIVEGAKKALVLYYKLGQVLNVVGLPGITPRAELIDELADFKRKYFIPDPGVCEKQIGRFAERLTNLRLVTLPVKPDDAFVNYGMERDDLRAMFRTARVLT